MGRRSSRIFPSTAGLQVGWGVTGTVGSTTVISGSINSVDSAHQVTVNRNATATGTGISITFGGEFSRPTQLFDFDPSSNTLSPVSPAIPDTSLNSRASYVTRMLVLPTGQLLFSDSSSQLYVYTPDGAPSPALRPVVNNVAYNGGGVFTLYRQTIEWAVRWVCLRRRCPERRKLSHRAAGEFERKCILLPNNQLELNRSGSEHYSRNGQLHAESGDNGGELHAGCKRGGYHVIPNVHQHHPSGSERPISAA